MDTGATYKCTKCKGEIIVPSVNERVALLTKINCIFPGCKGKMWIQTSTEEDK